VRTLHNREYEDYIGVNESETSSNLNIFLQLSPDSLKRTAAQDQVPRSPALLRFIDAFQRSSHEADSEWLGHSDFSTTANIYAHLEYSSKLSSADAMLSGLGIKAS
jgi:site-specific recombinase XerC